MDPLGIESLNVHRSARVWSLLKLFFSETEKISGVFRDHALNSHYGLFFPG